MLPSASTAEFLSGGKKENLFASWKWLIFQMLQILHVIGSYSLGFCCALLSISSLKALLTSLALDLENLCDLQLEISTSHYFVYDKNSFIFLCFTLEMNTLIQWKMWAL